MVYDHAAFGSLQEHMISGWTPRQAAGLVWPCSCSFDFPVPPCVHRDFHVHHSPVPSQQRDGRSPDLGLPS